MTACVDGTGHAFIHQGHPEVAACLLSGNDWDAGQCSKVVAVTGPGHCYNTKEGETCESGGMIPTH